VVRSFFHLLIVVAVSGGFAAGSEATVEHSAQAVVAALSGQSPVAHLTPHLLNLALHGHSLSPEQQRRLSDLGFDFSRRLVSRSRQSRPEADGLDRFLDAGIFRFHYTLSGTHAVASDDINGNQVPDYIDRMVSTFLTVAGQTLTLMGYTQPPGDGWVTGNDNGGSNHYDIYVRNLGYGLYGYTQSEYYADHGTGDNENSTLQENNAITSYMVMRNRYENFPTPELESIQVTAAHEFFHAIQFGYDAQEMPWLMEATAVWMEEAIFDDINDSYQYLPTWFNAPHIALDAEGTHWYGSFIYFEYIDEHLGGWDAIRRIWESSIIYNSANGDFSHRAIDRGLEPELSSFSDALNKMVIANRIMSSSPNAGIYQYEEAEDYPVTGPATYRSVTYVKGSPQTVTSTNLQRYASQYVRLQSDTPVKVTVTNLTGPDDDLELHAILKTVTGDYVVRSRSPVNIDPTAGYDWMYVAVVSHRTNGTDWDYRLDFTDGVYDTARTGLPEDFSLSNPYPNPLDRSAASTLRQVKFSLTVMQTQRMRITVVDLTGRRVATIFDGELKAGSGAYPFSWTGRSRTGRPVPSGVYFIVADGKRSQKWRRVTVLK
jgi:hypothetical protein